MGGVAFGSPLTSANTNAGFLEKNADDATVGKLGLHNADVASGTQFDNAQEEINGLNSFSGRTVNAGATSLPSWTNNDVGTNTDNTKVRADSLTRKFNNTAGHTHKGTPGDAPKIDFSDLTGTSAIPVWVKYTVGFSSLSFAGTSNDIELFSLGAKSIIQRVVIHHTTNFTGGSISAYKVSVGVTGELDRYTSPFDVFAAASNTNFQQSNTGGLEDFGAATSIRIAAVSTGANLSAATQGSVDIYVFGTTLP